ncbi:hypothetical protein C0J52_27760 [Blattella germanica]|nr:hypothetical protein C0J52_27760 [Blattella germanica]
MAMRPLSPDLEEVALKELNEDPARREQDLKHLRDWLSKQPHLIARQDFEKAKITDLMKVNLMMMDIMLEEDDRSIICGTVNVMDHKNSKLSDLSHYSPALVKKATTLFQVYLHSDMDSVLEQVPKRVLPQEYGGDAGPLDKITADWKKKVEGYRTWFKEQEKYRSDEKKRPGKAKTQEDLFGLEGSFRQLNVD